MNSLKLSVMPDRLAVCWLSAGTAVPGWVMGALAEPSGGPGQFLSITRTAGELSVVCDERRVPPAVRAERAWRGLVVEGPLDFGLTGILAGLARTLAEASVAIFVLSTFETDIILVKDEMLARAVDALGRAGYELHV